MPINSHGPYKHKQLFALTAWHVAKMKAIKSKKGFKHDVDVIRDLIEKARV